MLNFHTAAAAAAVLSGLLFATWADAASQTLPKTILEEQTAPELKTIGETSVVADFGKDAYSHVILTIKAKDAVKFDVLSGEVLNENGTINGKPGGSRIFHRATLNLTPGQSDFMLVYPPHKNPYGGMSRPQTPEILPIRYIGWTDTPGVEVVRVKRIAHFPEFDDNASAFTCPDKDLIRVWDFCKYSLKACIPFGLYIDGNRERLPYEADSYITALSHFALDANYSAARVSIEWSLDNPTWPTEWRILMPELVRVYYLYSGDETSLKRWYDKLKPFLLSGSLDSNGLLTSKKYPNGVRDIVDWPEKERDGYEMKEVNLVPNCYRHQALLNMAWLAEQIGRPNDAAAYRKEAAALKAKIRELMFDGRLFVDSPGSKHHAVHSLMVPVVTGVANPEDAPAIAAALKDKGMACSVYASQYLLDACFLLGLEDHAVKLMTEPGPRGWLNMMKLGATVTMEAWDNSVKPNQDWNHSWSTAPANIVARRLFGIRPVSPGFASFSVDPAVSVLKNGFYRQPTPHGPIEVTIRDGKVTVKHPAGTTRVSPVDRFLPRPKK